MLSETWRIDLDKAWELNMLEAVLKMSFGLPPLSAGLVPSFKSFDPPQADLRFEAQPRRACPGVVTLLA